MHWPPKDALAYYESSEFEELVDSICYQLLARYASQRQVVQDAVYDCSTDLLLELIMRSHGEPHPFASFPTAAHFGTYLRQRCTWRVVDRLRSEARHPSGSLSFPDEEEFASLTGGQLSPEDWAIYHETIQSLSEELRTTMETYLQVGTVKDVAIELRISVRTVQRHLESVRQIFQGPRDR